MICLSFLTIVSVFLFCLSLLTLPLNTSPNGKYSNLALSTTPGYILNSSPVKYSCLPSSLDNNAEILALSKSY